MSDRTGFAMSWLLVSGIPRFMYDEKVSIFAVVAAVYLSDNVACRFFVGHLLCQFTQHIFTYTRRKTRMFCLAFTLLPNQDIYTLSFGTS